MSDMSTQQQQRANFAKGYDPLAYEIAKKTMGLTKDFVCPLCGSKESAVVRSLDRQLPTQNPDEENKKMLTTWEKAAFDLRFNCLDCEASVGVQMIEK